MFLPGGEAKFTTYAPSDPLGITPQVACGDGAGVNSSLGTTNLGISLFSLTIGGAYLIMEYSTMKTSPFPPIVLLSLIVP
jgi:hypothetical protein